MIGIKKSFENIKDNIQQILDLKRYLENITKFDAFDTSYLEQYNKKFLELFDKISEDNIFYYSFMESLLKYMKVLFPEKNPISYDNFLDSQIDDIIKQSLLDSQKSQSIDNSINNISNDVTDNVPEKKVEQETNSKLEQTIPSEDQTQEFVENTLLIYEKKDIAILPYSIVELEEYFSNHPENYSSIQDIINKEYTVSLKKYKNVAFSRFREAFNLAKNKCNLSFIEAVNLANELFFNTNLNPLIITACKDIDELDIYLSCLEDNILDDFKCFNISYL